MSNVKFRKEENGYLVYFTNERTNTMVNKTGKVALDMIINQGNTIEEVIKFFIEQYDGVKKEQVEKEIKVYLKEILDRLGKNTFNEAEQLLLKAPLGVEIEITTACNMRCRHCFQGDYPQKYMEFEKFKKIVDILCHTNVYEINLVGGEIFCHKELHEMIKYIKNKNMAITIVTNGLVIDDKWVNILTDLPNLHLLLSMDGIGKVHDYIRGEGKYIKLQETLKKLQQKNINVEVLTTLNAYNAKYVDEIVDYTRETGIPANFNLFKPFGNRHKDLILEPNEFFSIMKKLLFKRTKEGYKLGVSDAGLVAYMLGLPERNECTATLAGLVITVDGKMLTCPYLLEIGYYKIDDLPDFDENYINEWANGRIFNEFRNNGLKNCQARSLIFSGDVKGYDPYGLEAYKKMLFDIQSESI
ncbi:MAG: radical SAM protein [Clostridia bacterium]|nr:radical SAM protein [Clostridia bacterium]